MAKVIVFLIIRWLVEGDPRESKVLRFVDTIGNTSGFYVVRERIKVLGANHSNLA